MIRIIIALLMLLILSGCSPKASLKRSYLAPCECTAPSGVDSGWRIWKCPQDDPANCFNNMPQAGATMSGHP
jgi:hypothetical protein